MLKKNQLLHTNTYTPHIRHTHNTYLRKFSTRKSTHKHITSSSSSIHTTWAKHTPFGHIFREKERERERKKMVMCAGSIFLCLAFSFWLLLLDVYVPVSYVRNFIRYFRSTIYRHTTNESFSICQTDTQTGAKSNAIEKRRKGKKHQNSHTTFSPFLGFFSAKIPSEKKTQIFFIRFAVVKCTSFFRMCFHIYYCCVYVIVYICTDVELRDTPNRNDFERS